MTFEECAVFCIKQRGLVEQFDRLRGTHLLPFLNRSPIDVMIDEATGNEPSDEDMALWMDFVWDCIWTRLPPEAFAVAGEQQP